MSYLTDAVTEIRTAAENAAFLHVAPTEHVNPTNAWDAREYAERFYRQDRGYDGALHTVSEEVEDGFHVMIMEER